MDPDAILRFNNILEEVTKQEEFSLDTPVNKSILKDIGRTLKAGQRSPFYNLRKGMFGNYQQRMQSTFS